MTTEPRPRLPEWLKVRMPGSPGFLDLRNRLRMAELHTVCEEAHCPNIGECWERKSATFMILGEICTRACRYCAVTSGKPTVITFATPAFCQSATCGPQVDVISAIKDRHKGEANFIHIEVYENPKEMEGDISKGRLSPILTEWGLQSEPFTFVIDSDGLVAANLQGFVTEDEVRVALEAVLGP